MKTILRKSKGQTVVEFALVLPVLIFLLLAIMEGGRIFAAYIEIQHAARDGARYAAINCPSKKEDQSAWVTSNLTPLIQSRLSTLDPVHLNVGFLREDKSEIWVEVTLTYPLPITTPIISNITGNPFTLSSKMAMRSEKK